MNQSVILLISSLVIAIIAINFLIFRNSVLVAKNKLYHEFTQRTSVPKFIAILEGVGHKVIDSDILLMLQKYFELVLLRLDKKDVSNLLISLNKSKFSSILRESLINATIKADDSIFGLAIAANIENFEAKLVIELFIEELPAEDQRRQYKAAFNTLKHDYDRGIWDYPSEFRMPVEKAMKEFEEKSL